MPRPAQPIEQIAADRVVLLGQSGGAFGVKGWVRVTAYTDPPENILEYDEWLIGGAGGWRPIEIEDGRMTSKGVQVKLAGVETPEEARLRTGVEIAVRRSSMPAPEPGEY